MSVIIRCKKLLVLFLLTVLFITQIGVFADNPEKDEVIKIVLDGETCNLGVDLVMKQNEIFIPIQPLCALLGEEFIFNESEGMVGIYSADATVEFKLDSEYIDINGGNVLRFDVPPTKFGNTLMVPLNFLTTALGLEAYYIPPTHTVKINYFSLMEGKLRVGGSARFLNISQQVIDFLKKLNPYLQANVLAGGSSSGVKGCESGEFNIANIDRNLTPDELYNNPDLASYRIAKEGIAIIVHPSNPLEKLNLSQVYHIFSEQKNNPLSKDPEDKDRIINWKQVGGKDEPILVNIHEAGSGTLNSFYDSAIYNMCSMEKGRPDYVGTAMPHASNGLVRQAVAAEPLAIGFVAFPFVDSTVKPVSVGDVEPSPKSVLEKKWPYVNNLNIVTKGKANSLTSKYINFLRSSRGRKIIEEEGFINLETYLENRLD